MKGNITMNVKNKKILVIVAHPDDEVLGMGGTIAKCAANGAEIGLLIVTDGSTSQYKDIPNLHEIIEEKKQETKRSADILGIKHIYYGKQPDMKLDVTEHIRVNNAIENVVNEFNPDIVFTHFDGDVNKDHQCVFQSILFPLLFPFFLYKFGIKKQLPLIAVLVFILHHHINGTLHSDFLRSGASAALRSCSIPLQIYILCGTDSPLEGCTGLGYLPLTALAHALHLHPVPEWQKAVPLCMDASGCHIIPVCLRSQPYVLNT